MTNWGDVYEGLCWSEFLSGVRCAEEMSCGKWWEQGQSVYNQNCQYCSLTASTQQRRCSCSAFPKVLKALNPIKTPALTHLFNPTFKTAQVPEALCLS